MELVIAVCACIGAWLLVAGPLYQGALELLEHDLDHQAGGRIPPPPPPSSWWWLLPPVMLALRRRRAGSYNREILSSLSPQQRAQRSIFIRKATGWFIVGSGAALLAVKETWELAERGDWPLAGFAALLALMAVLVGANTAALIGRQRRLFSES